MATDKKATAGQSNDNHPDEQEHVKTRRDALRKILAGTGVVAGAKALPEKWTKPVVNSIIVPAHAQTTGPEQTTTTTAAPPTTTAEPTPTTTTTTTEAPPPRDLPPPPPPLPR